MITRTSCTSYCPLQRRRNDVFIGEVELLYSLRITFSEGHVPFGTVSSSNASSLITSSEVHWRSQDPGRCFIHFLDTPQVANSELKCVIQYYMSGQLRKDVNCKWKLGGREAEAVSSLSPGDIRQPSRCWASSSSAVICERSDWATPPL